MHPTLGEIPGWHAAIASQDAMVFLAVLFGLTFGPWSICRVEGLRASRVVAALGGMALAALLGGHLHFVLNTWSIVFADRPLAALKFWKGMHAGGAVTGLLLFAPPICRTAAVPLGRLADALIPAAGVSIAVARFGCFLNGCCSGTTCRWPWCVTFPATSYIYAQHSSLGLLPPGALRSAPIHPLQLYFALVGLALAILALALRRRRRYEGEVAIAALFVFCAAGAGLEFLRADYAQRAYWGVLPQLTWIALALGAIAAVALVLGRLCAGVSGLSRWRAE